MDQPIYIYYDWNSCPLSVRDISKVVKLASQGRAPIKRRVVAGKLFHSAENLLLLINVNTRFVR
jgi:hypothetical protein